MRQRIMVVVGLMSFAVSLGWYVVAQQTTSLPTFVSGQVLRAAARNATMAQAEANTDDDDEHRGDHDRPLHVNCNAGESLRKALRHAQPGSTIRVRGTCTERVTITTDRLTLDGRGTAVLDGGGAVNPDRAEVAGVLTIDGARGVTITGFTIQNGHDGIVGTGGATFALRHTTVQDNALDGMRVQNNSTVEITDCTARRNGFQGIEIVSSSVLFRGTIRSTDNVLLDGIFIIGGGSVATFQGATVEANNNGRAGLSGGGGATLLISGVRAGAPSSLTTNGNGAHGIFLFPGATFESNANDTITLAHNGNGVFLIGNAVMVNNPAPGLVGGKFVIENNVTGVHLNMQSGLFANGGLTVRNNTTGLLADSADFVTVVSTPLNPSSITGNGTDVDLRFGVRSTFVGVDIGSITCDDTVLSRGTTVCP